MSILLSVINPKGDLKMKAVLREGCILGGFMPTDAVVSGMAAAEAADRIIIGRSGESRAKELALASGILSMGKSVLSLGRCLETELFFASRLAKCDLCIFVRDDKLLKLDVREMGGVPLSKVRENAISAALLSEREPDTVRAEGSFTYAGAFREIYSRHIERLIPENCSYSLKISSSSPICEKILFSRKGNEELVIQLSPDGMKAAVYSDKSGFVPYEKLIFICCNYLFMHGIDVALPFDFTFTAEEFARLKGRHIYRYYATGDGETDKTARRLAREQNFTLDGLFLAARVISILCERKISLKEAVSEIPEFYTAKRFVPADDDRIKKVVNHWEGKRTPDGTAFTDNKKRVIVRPSSTGKGVWLSVESYSVEAATELCGEIEEKIKRG